MHLVLFPSKVPIYLLLAIQKKPDPALRFLLLACWLLIIFLNKSLGYSKVQSCDNLRNTTTTTPMPQSEQIGIHSLNPNHPCPLHLSLCSLRNEYRIYKRREGYEKQFKGTRSSCYVIFGNFRFESISSLEILSNAVKDLLNFSYICLQTARPDLSMCCC